jgi:hypothetical protein
LYNLILTVDANFRLKRKDRSTKNDHALGSGLGYWVPDDGYRAHIAKFGHQEEVKLRFLRTSDSSDNQYDSQPYVTQSSVQLIMPTQSFRRVTTLLEWAERFVHGMVWSEGTVWEISRRARSKLCP